ncbi:putative MscS family protein.1 precursor [Crateriforma conspicua]|nr:putative MscS family protein.1 precursor [Crateriforma conspicua]
MRPKLITLSSGLSPRPWPHTNIGRRSRRIPASGHAWALAIIVALLPSLSTAQQIIVHGPVAPPLHGQVISSTPVGRPVIVSERVISERPMRSSSSAAVTRGTQPTSGSTIVTRPIRNTTSPETNGKSTFANTRSNTTSRFGSPRSARTTRPSQSSRSSADPVAKTNPSSVNADPASYPLLPKDHREPDDWATSVYADQHLRSARDSIDRFDSIYRSGAPVIADVAYENAQFVRQWVEAARSYLRLSDQVHDADRNRRSTLHDFQEVQQKLEHHGLTPTVGLLLRHKKEQLDQWQVEHGQATFVNQALSEARQQQLKLDLVEFDGSDPIAQASRVLAKAGYRDVPDHDPLRRQVEELLDQRYAWLDSLRTAYDDYQNKLSELDSVTNASRDLADEYRALIDRHVAWIRSDDPISLGDLQNFKSGMGALFDAQRSADFGPTVERKLRDNPVAGISTLAWIIVALAIRWLAKSWLIGIGNKKRLRKTHPMRRKLSAGILTVVVATGIPSCFFLISRWLGDGIVSEATLYASSAFAAGSLVALFIEVPRQWLRAGGYLDQHVDIELERRPRAMTYLTIVGTGLVIAAYAVTLMGLMNQGMWRGSVSRIGFITAMLLVAWTLHRSFKPTGGFLEPLIEKFCGSVIHHARLLLYIAALAFPVAMIGLSALGYGFTTAEIIRRAIWTAVIAMSAAMIWPGLKFASEELWERITGMARDQADGDVIGGYADTGKVSGALGEHFLELKHHLAFLCQCGLVLAAIFGFGWLWIDVFPNADVGNPVVWTVDDVVTQTVIDADGTSSLQSRTEPRPVTAFHLVLAAATLFVAFQLAKLLPALYDALVLQRVSFDEGMEHFTFILGRVLIFGIGCLIAGRFIGLRWQTIQWLAVGLTIGLGFGLQDMVRNLFGGLIVLFEKPARLGDRITVGKVTGRVAAQRLRTTVLADDDGREVIVPNKNFVSTDVVNWMGAGRLSAVAMEVSTTRDQRPADLCRMLQELMIEQPDVLLTPAPQATLVCVGQRSQRIEVRVWVEETKSVSRYRDQMLRLIRTFLSERDLLAGNQPSQPELADVMPGGDELDHLFDDDFDTPNLSKSTRRRRPA